MSISILVLTHNEEINLPGCLASVRWSDDVVVFDSFSTDCTPEIARDAGARVIQHAFVNYGSQREAARMLVPYKHPWVLALDADERPDEELVREVCGVASQPMTDTVAYRVRRKDHFQGRWIKHSTLYPSWFVRLYRPDQVRYPARAVHEYPETLGRLGALGGHLIHEPFAKGLDHWWARHRRYAELEAREMAAEVRADRGSLVGIMSRDPVRRRRALKALSFQLPARPWLRFFYMYVLRQGFLDGVPGYRYCAMIAEYQHLIDRHLAAAKNDTTCRSS